MIAAQSLRSGKVLVQPENGWLEAMELVSSRWVRAWNSSSAPPSDVVAAFDDPAVAIEDCPRGCSHLGPPADPECALDEAVLVVRLSSRRLIALRRILTALRPS